MTETSAFETCSVNLCLSPAVTTEHARVGHWYVTIFYCDEHARELEQGTPLGPVGLDQRKIRIEPLGAVVPSPQPGRMPGID